MKEKIITLCVTLAVLIVVIFVYSKQANQKKEVVHPTIVSNEVSHEDGFILLDGGEVSIGSPTSERQRNVDEQQHKVTLDAFYISPYEVSQQDYASLMGSNPSYFEGDTLPVDSVSYFDALQYCNALSEKEGLRPVYTIDGTTVTWDRSADGYRLPTEAEWEYAARANTDTIFYAGDQITSEDANFEGSYPYLIEGNYVNHHDANVLTSENRGTTIPVDSLQPNGFGLFNMYGNVAEWCFDYYGAYDLENTDNPSGPTSGMYRIVRGGSYNLFAKQLRSAYRSIASANHEDQNLGFRLVRNATSKDTVVETTQAVEITTPQNPNILVVYFSYSGNTENGANIIAQYLNADIVEIQMQQPYSGNIYEVSQYDLNNNIKPELTNTISSIDDYDVIILGYPTWWSTMPMPVFTFLESYDFSNKTILPFSSNGGTRFGDSISDLCKKVTNCDVKDGFEYTYSGGSGLSDELIHWLETNGVTQ